MKKTHFFKIFPLVCLVLAFLPSCGKSPEQQASDFLDVGMPEQAMVILRGEILKAPKNPKLHFLLGKSLLALGNLEEAQEAFDRASRLDSAKGKMIGKTYIEVGKKELDRDNLKGAFKLFSLAIKYDPSLKQLIGEYCLVKGKDILAKEDSEEVGNACDLFAMAAFYEPSLKVTISKEFFADGKKAFFQNDLKRARRFFVMARENDPTIKFNVNFAAKLVDGKGQPLPNVKIIAKQVLPIKGYEQFETLTDADGVLTLKGLFPASEYVISLNSSDIIGMMKFETGTEEQLNPPVSPLSVISKAELTSITWKFGRTTGWISGSLFLRANGKIEGYSNPNEYRWGMDRNNLVFYDASGKKTTMFNSFVKKEGRWFISGPFLLGGNVTHVLEENE